MQPSTSSSKPTNYKQKLNQLLESLPDINLTGYVFDESIHVYGRGGSGDVHKAKCRRYGSIDVAVKRLRIYIPPRDHRGTKSLVRELSVWASVKHPNVLRLLGYTMSGAFPSLISPWITRGSVRKIMDFNSNESMLHLYKGISAGLLYLHERDIVHADLKCENILLSDSGEPLLADFGISRCLSSISTTSSTSAKGSARWMAIELFVCVGDYDVVVQHTKATDVWAFGMVLFELLSNLVPFTNLKTDAQVTCAIARGHTPLLRNLPAHENSRDYIWSICQDCWKKEPSRRPTMTTISWRLQILHTASQLGIIRQHALQDLASASSKSRRRIGYCGVPPSGGGVVGSLGTFFTDDDFDKFISEGALSSPVSYFADTRRFDPSSGWIQGRLLSKNTYGRVFLGQNARSGELVTVKQYEIPEAGDDVVYRQARVVEALKRETQEKKNLLDLDHSNIVRYLGFEHSARSLKMFFEYVPSISLADCLWKQGKLEDRITRIYIRQILDGLDYLHTNGIIHRNLHSRSIIVDHKGACKISDFEFSKTIADIVEDHTHTPETEMMYWLAPEIASNARIGEPRDYDEKVDIWSLGCVLTEIWAGRDPWQAIEAKTIRHGAINRSQAPPLPYFVSLSPSAEDFRQKCFSINPIERPSARELRQDPYLLHSGSPNSNMVDN